MCYHALNRGNRRAVVFHDTEDYGAFVHLFAPASGRVSMRVLAYCLMPNHFHLVLWPRHDGDLSAWMQWLLTSYVRHYQRRFRSTGHVGQGRFKAFPIQEDEHLLTVLRYVERNPLRAGLVPSARLWPWSSLGRWQAAGGQLIGPSGPTAGRFDAPWLVPGPVARPADGPALVDAVMHEGELKGVRQCVARERPFGAEAWAEQTAAALGLESSLRRQGRPSASTAARITGSARSSQGE